MDPNAQGLLQVRDTEVSVRCERVDAKLSS